MADKKQEITSLKDANAGVSKSDNLDSYINSKFIRAKSARKNDEDRWLQAYRNYRGVYGPDVTFTDTEKSQIFIKVTKTKVLAAYGQIVDVLFSHNRFPIGVEPTAIPEGVVESVNVDPKKTEAIDVMEKQFPDLYGFAGDGKDLQPGDTPDSLLGRLGPLTEDLQDINNLLVCTFAMLALSVSYLVRVFLKVRLLRIKNILFGLLMVSTRRLSKLLRM